MTLLETAATMRRTAEVFEQIGRVCPEAENPDSPSEIAMLDENQATGAGIIVCYLRDLFTNSPRETFQREDILVILEAISRDPELFPCGIGVLLWQADDEDEV